MKPPQAEPRSWPVTASLLYAASAALGALVLLGWAVGSNGLTRVVPSLVAMQPATALDFVMLGLAGLILGRGAWRRWLATALAVSVAVLAGTGLVTEVVGIPYPLAVLGFEAQNQGRMSGITAVAHLVLAAAVAAVAWGQRRHGHLLGLVAVLVGLVALSGYAYGTSDLYGVGYFQTLALHTAVGILLLGSAIMAGTGDIGLASLVRSSTVGGTLVRQMLPVVVLTPTLLGWVTLWVIRGQFIGPGFAFALYATLVALTSGIVVWSTAVRLRAVDLRRVSIEQAFTERDALATQLAAANRELRDFTAAAAHDLRGPLSGVAMGVQLLRELDDEESQRFALDRIERSTQRGLALIDSLLDYENVGLVQSIPSPLDLEIVVRRVRMNVEESTGRRIDLQLEDLAPVLADADLVERLLTNLIGNAVKYTPVTADPVALLVAARETSGSWVEVGVADAGSPIAALDRTRIFDIFQRGSATAKVAGTGVGLAISRRVVERHGGRIWVDDLDGWSKRFVFTLPARATPHPDRAAEAHLEKDTPAENALAPAHTALSGV